MSTNESTFKIVAVLQATVQTKQRNIRTSVVALSCFADPLSFDATPGIPKKTKIPMQAITKTMLNTSFFGGRRYLLRSANNEAIGVIFRGSYI
jgi:hypothetical protein